MRKSLLIIPIVHLLLYIAISLDIFVFRQIIVFVYLSFIPGFVLLKILRPQQTSAVEVILFSVGLSVAFLMFTGLLINQLCLLLGFSQPLTTIPLTIILSIPTLILFAVGFRKDLSENFNSLRGNIIDSKVSSASSVILFLPVLLGIIGALYLNQLILLLMLITVAILFALSVFSNRLIPCKLYPLVIFAISIALAFHFLLTSEYILGYDAKFEYYVFKLTANNGYWHLLPAGIAHSITVNLDSMLSVTILPTIYSALMNINGEIVFKALYPFVFSLVPVALYQIYERQIGKTASLLSSLFFISAPAVFYGFEPLSLNRQVVAMFFLALSILVFLDKTMPIGKRRLLIAIFGAALVVSHYSSMFIYLFLAFSIYALSKLKGHSHEVFNGKMVVLLFIMAFSWYTFSVGPLDTLSQFFQQVISRFSTDIFNAAARSESIFASHPILNFASMINWVFFYTAHFFILIGILVLLFKPAKTKLAPKYRIVAILSAVVLFLCVVVPNIGPALNFQRFYAITLLFLAPCFVLGGETLVGILQYVVKRATGRHPLSNIHKQISTVLLCMLLVGYFLSQSGFINCIAGASPLSFPLDYNRIRISTDPNTLNSISFYSVYIPDQDVFSALWLSKNIDESTMIYADRVSSQNVLPSYALIPYQQISIPSNTTMLEQGGIIFLGQLNVVNGIMTTFVGSFNTSDIYPLLDETNLVYSNGNSEVWYISSPSYGDYWG